MFFKNFATISKSIKPHYLNLFNELELTVG